MTVNLLDMLKDQIGDAEISQAGSFLGAENSGVKSAMGIALPSILGSIIASGSTAEGSKGLIDMIRQGGHDGSVFNNLGSVLDGDSTSGILNSGSGILKFLMGNKLGSVVDIISAVSGLKKGSSSTIMSMTAPLVIGMVGKYFKNKSLDAMGLSKFLVSQSPYVADALPTGMGNLLGFSIPSMGDKVEAAAESAHEIVAEATGEGSSLWKRVLPLVLVLGALYLGWNYISESKMTDAISNVGETVGDAAITVGDAATTVGQTVGKTVGKTVGDAANSAGEIVSDAADIITEGAKKTMEGVTFGAGSVGEKFSNYLESDRTGDGTFAFKNLTFESGSAAIQDVTEVNNLAKVLSVYDKINIEVGGHTDSSGAADTNLVLSQSRADAVKSQLVAQGIAENRITAKGFGSTAPTTDNAADAANRRVEIKIMKE